MSGVYLVDSTTTFNKLPLKYRYLNGFLVRITLVPAISYEQCRLSKIIVIISLRLPAANNMYIKSFGRLYDFGPYTRFKKLGVFKTHDRWSNQLRPGHETLYVRFQTNIYLTISDNVPADVDCYWKTGVIVNPLSVQVLRFFVKTPKMSCKRRAY